MRVSNGADAVNTRGLHRVTDDDHRVGHGPDAISDHRLRRVRDRHRRRSLSTDAVNGARSKQDRRRSSGGGADAVHSLRLIAVRDRDRGHGLRADAIYCCDQEANRRSGVSLRTNAVKRRGREGDSNLCVSLSADTRDGIWRDEGQDNTHHHDRANAVDSLRLRRIIHADGHLR
jgi:hypothetical protein